MYCSKCGKEVKEIENFCSGCGAKIVKLETNQEKTVVSGGYQPIRQTTVASGGYQPIGQTTVVDSLDDKPTAGLMILSFFIPIAGLVLYCVWSGEAPKKAKCCLKVLIGSIVFYSIVIFCVISSIISTAEETYYYEDTFYSNVVEVIE